MKKVLYIVYYYPPLGGSGVQRGTKFSKYLPLSGWESVVLTPYPALVKHPKDRSLLEDMPSGQAIYRTFTLDAHWLYKVFWGLRLPKVVTWLMFHIFRPDAEILWLPFAKLQIPRILKRHKIDLVFISGPPFSIMQLGKWIKDRYGIPYVASFRDDWSLGQSRLDNPPPPSFTKYERKLEKAALEEANHVVVVNKAYKRDFLSLYPHLAEDKFTVITNGYDESDFEGQPPQRERDKGKLQIVHPGVLFGRRHPGIIWQAILNLIDRGKIDPRLLRIHIYGRNFSSFVFKGFEQNHTIRSIVRLHPYLPHDQTIDVIRQADLLLLYSGPGAKSDAEMPGKLFEYLRTGKPILGIIHPEGVSAQILHKAGSGFVASQEDIAQIEETLLQIYQLWQNKELAINPDWEYIKTFERRELSAKLASVFDRVLQEK
ncbi:MAG: glycosyltransferase family 4 protein [Candidatus Cloacimonetes bacterium]|nr:glycosyltransferase [Candidatus Cloacimonadota bacterium]NLO11386.1 glycosyltransferase family 4 protein [Candidatus Cloacimonadota bacterium]